MEWLPGFLFIVLVFAFLHCICAWIAGPGAGTWKGLAFLCCLSAMLFAIFAVQFLLLTWLLAWAFAAVAISTIRRERMQRAIQAALQEQNQMLRQRQQGGVQ